MDEPAIPEDLRTPYALERIAHAAMQGKSAAEHAVARLAAERDRLLEEIASLRDRLGAAEQQLQKSREDRDAFAQSFKDRSKLLRVAAAERDKLREQLAESESERKAIDNHLHAAYEAIGLSQYSSKPLASAIRAKVSELEAERDRLKEQLVQSKATYEVNLCTQKANDKQVIDELRFEGTDLEAELDRLRKQLAESEELWGGAMEVEAEAKEEARRERDALAERLRALIDAPKEGK